MLRKIQTGDKVAILSPSFAAPGLWPHIYQLGLTRLRDQFGLDPVAYPTTSKRGASAEERAQDLIDAFTNPEIKAVITTLGGDDQITYVKYLPDAPFRDNPKPFFGFSDNTHFVNHLWLNGVPSYYGAALFTQFAFGPEIDDFTLRYLNRALFESGETELTAAPAYNDIELDWFEPANMTRERTFEKNEGWFWDGDQDAEGITWGGCIESIDEILRHNVRMPSLEQFENVILLAETSEEIPTHDYVRRVFRALGERGILERVKGVLIGRPKAYSLHQPNSSEWKANYRKGQREMTVKEIRHYNPTIPIVQNLDYGHTNPQIPVPYGSKAKILCSKQKITIEF